MPVADLVTTEDLQDEFSTFGIALGQQETDKCVEICTIYGVEAEDLVEKWMAYSATHLRGAQPDLDKLKLLEGEIVRTRNKPDVHTTDSPQIYNSNNISKLLESDNILAAYSTPTSKKGVKRSVTPTAVNNTPKRGSALLAGKPDTTLYSPSMRSPSIGSSQSPSGKYSSRKNRGDVTVKFGATDDLTWSNTNQNTRSIKRFESCPLTSGYKYMHERLREKGDVFSEKIEVLSNEMKQLHTLSDFQHIQLTTRDDTWCAGRICCDSVGRLNATSVLLEGDREVSGGNSIPLDVSHLSTYSLFPGQVVTVMGTNPEGKKITATDLHIGCTPAKPNTKPNFKDPLQLVVAAGPFSLNDNLLYEPLSDLLEYIEEHSPDVVVILGPIVDSKHPLIASGQGDLAYKDIFAAQMDRIAQIATRSLRVIVVSSWRDVHHDCVYPTPPYTLPTAVDNLYLVSDPALVSIDGYVLALTSTDVLMHLGKEEINKNTPGDRLGRLCKHILLQQNMYPLYPPNEEMCIDTASWEQHTPLPITPHMLVLPSDMRAFVKTIEGCVVVNPERMTRGAAGGCYVRAMIHGDGEKVMAEVVRI